MRLDGSGMISARHLGALVDSYFAEDASMAKKLVRGLSVLALIAAPFATARADLVLVQLDANTGQGFGNANTIFTLQVTGGNQTLGTQVEQGCYAFGDVTGAFNVGDNSVAGTGTNIGNLCTENGANQV